MNSLRENLLPVHQGIAMGLLALILGALWAAYIATHHEQLHGGFEQQEAAKQAVELAKAAEGMEMGDMQLEVHAHDSYTDEHHHAVVSTSHHPAGHDKHAGSHHAQGHAANGQHSHSGSLAMDAMQRLLRGHIHFMGIGLLSILMLILVASTTLKARWKKVFAWTFGLGALAYPPAWILMGFRTVELGPQGAEASVLWLFGPAVGLLLGSIVALFLVLGVECLGLKKRALFAWAFEQ